MPASYKYRLPPIPNDSHRLLYHLHRRTVVHIHQKPQTIL